MFFSVSLLPLGPVHVGLHETTLLSPVIKISSHCCTVHACILVCKSIDIGIKKVEWTPIQTSPTLNISSIPPPNQPPSLCYYHPVLKYRNKIIIPKGLIAFLKHAWYSMLMHCPLGHLIILFTCTYSVNKIIDKSIIGKASTQVRWCCT